MATEDTPGGSVSPSPEGQPAAPQLRLLDRRAFVGFPPLEVRPGISIVDFGLQIPDVSFPFNVGAGVQRYQRRKLHFGFLEVAVDAEVIRRSVQAAAASALELSDVALNFRSGWLEGEARLKGPAPVGVTFKVAFDADGERLGVYLYDVRMYGFSPVPSATVPLLLSRAAQSAAALPDVEVRGANGFSARVLPQLVTLAAVSRGFRMPSLDGARLAAVEVSPTGLRLRFASGALPPPALHDDELLLTLEGARAFAEAEALVSAGKLADAREAYLRGAGAEEAHPFALERLLALLVADPGAHEYALDVLDTLARRRPGSAAPMWAEAVVRERRGEPARSAERWLALVQLARKRGEDASAFAAAEAAARVAEGQAPQMAVKALHAMLGIRPDHLPSLKALARAADQAQDRAGAMRAYRRLSALARDPVESAEAHVQLARLSALTEDDVAGARLHCEAALKLAPDLPGALELLGELCARAGEPLRALKAFDRLRDVALGRHELALVGRANLRAGEVWETGLRQLDNALLRYREAVSLLPGDVVALVAQARVSEALGRIAEAVTGYQQAAELAGPSPQEVAVRRAAHAAHHALAALAQSRFGDATQAREHWEAALSLVPDDARALEALVPAWRAAGDPAALAHALERAAPTVHEPTRRAGFLAEAGELHRTRLGNPDRAESLLLRALESEPRHRAALEGLVALGESRRDGPLLVRTLTTLAELAKEGAERARTLRRLAVAAKDLASDLEVAARALSEVLRLEPEDLLAWGELCALQRRRADMPGLSAALGARARVAEAQSDPRLAAACLRELAQVEEARLGRFGEALVALEKAARLDPRPEILLELADLSLRCERPEHARRALEDVLVTLPRTGPPEKLAEVRARLGQACEMSGDLAAAAAHYAESLPYRRGDDALAARLEGLYEKLGRSRELAELWAARARQLLADGRAEAAAPLLFKGARALLDDGQRDSAHRQLYAALEIAPRGVLAGQILEALADLELESGHRPEAATLFARQAALLADPLAAARLFRRGAELVRGEARELSLLDEALRLDPALADVRVRRAELRIEGEPRRALEDLEAALSLARADPSVLPPSDRKRVERLAAECAVRAGDAEAARRHLSAYADAAPDDVEALLQLAALHRSAGAVEALAALLSVLWPRLSGEQARAACTELVELSLELHRPGEALDALRRLVELDPTDLWALETLVGLLPPSAPGFESEALALRTRLVEQTSGAIRAAHRIERARLLRSRGDRTLAREELARAAPEAVQPGPLWREVALLAHESEDLAGELEAWRQAVRADRALAAEAGPRLLALGRVLLEPNPELSREALLEVTRLDRPSEAAEAWRTLARLDRRAGALDAASEALLRASELMPEALRGEVLLERAELAEERGDFLAAADGFRQVLQLSPRHPRALPRLRALLERSGDWAGVSELLEIEAERAPRERSAVLFAELGGLLEERLQREEEATAAFRRAVALAPDDGRSLERLLRLQLRQGNWSEAQGLLPGAARLLSADSAAELLRECARQAEAAGESTAALSLRRQAHALVPATGEALATLALSLYAAGARAEALPLFATLSPTLDSAFAPSRAAALLLAQADLLEASGELAEAEVALRRVIEKPDPPEAAVERLAALRSRTDPREAVTLLAEFHLRRPASEAAGRALIQLATRASGELADPELAERLLLAAGPLLAEPRTAHRARVELHRQTGRTAALLESLQAVASASMASGDRNGAAEALAEVAEIASRGDRPEGALSALEQLTGVLEEAGRKTEAAEIERQRAELLLRARNDLPGAAGALAHAFELSPDAGTASRAAALAEQRGDVRGRAWWLARAVPFLPTAESRTEALLTLAELHAGPLEDDEQAEGLLRDALAEVPGHAGAESLLIQLLERSGRGADLAAYYVAAARLRPEAAARAHLLRRAAGLYRSLGEVEDALEALVSAHGFAPADRNVATELADLLSTQGREADAAAYDAQLLREDPFHPAYPRHAAWLESAGDMVALGRLEAVRAERQVGAESARSWLRSAAAFRAGGREEEARAAEDSAFAQAPELDLAFSARRARVEGDVRALAQLLAQRARAVPTEAPALLTERAELLTRAGEALLAAEAWDELLQLQPEDVNGLLQRGELAATAGGPEAAQPYDRRVLQLAPDLPTPQRLKLQLRLGHAALATGALHDAADVLEAVVALDPVGERGREALSLLAEVHGRRHDAAGLFQTSVRLARIAGPEEAEALYRRAAALVDEPAQALEALLPLAELRPSEDPVVDRAVAGLLALSRHEDALALLERAADATGGPRAAGLLTQASRVAASALRDEPRALELIERAHQADPGNIEILRALAAGYRQAHASPEVLVPVLRALDEATPQGEESAQIKLELARHLIERGEADEARALLEPLAAGGRSGPGYAEALALLAPLLDSADDALARATVLAARAEMETGGERARLLFAAAQAAHQAGDEARAARLARASVATEASQEALLLLAQLMREASELAKAAASLTQAAQLASAEERPALLLEAADAWEGAGDPAEAQELLERVARLHPATLGPGAWAARFLRLGARAQALEHGYEPLLAQGAFAQALEIAETLQDGPRIRQSLWGLAQSESGNEALSRLSRLLLEEGSGAERQACAELAESRRGTDLANQLHRAILLSPPGEASADERLHAFQRLQAVNALDPVVFEALEQVNSETPPPLVDALIGHVRTRRGAERERGLRLLASRVPARAAPLWQALFEQARDDNRLADAAAALHAWVEATPEPVQRAGLRVQAGDLELALGRVEAAQEAWTRAGAEDPTSVPAATKLLALTSPEEAPERFVELAERLSSLIGPEVLEGYQEGLARAYLKLGRTSDALGALAQLPPTPERVRERAELAQTLGRTEEALALREQVATTPEEREALALTAARAGRHADTVRIVGKMSGPELLSAGARRELAELLGTSEAGAPLACVLWPMILGEHAVDPQAWAHYAEALRRMGRAAAAARAAAFGHLFAGEEPASTPVRVQPVERGPLTHALDLPPGALPVRPEEMPEVSRVLDAALLDLGTVGLSVWLDPTGAAEAWLAREDALVLGAGALSLFGPVELTYLVALALALGDQGALLVRPGDVPALGTAAAAAFTAVPSPPAAARVLLWLDPVARGADADTIDSAAVLTASTPLVAVVQRALALV
jgi:tetratricopeptide (TPR) repeat protein